MHQPFVLPEHQWLHQLIGEWTFEHPVLSEQGTEDQIYRGKETVRPFGPCWVLCEGQIDLPQKPPAQNLFTFGYDPHQKQFTGSFITSVMSRLWIYQGHLDRNTNSLILDTLGPDMTNPSVIKPYRDIICIKNADERILTSSTPGPDGNWTTFLTVSYKRA